MKTYCKTALAAGAWCSLLAAAVYFAGCGDDETKQAPVDAGVKGCRAEGEPCDTEFDIRGICMAGEDGRLGCYFSCLSCECTTVGDRTADGCCYYSADPSGNFVMPSGSKAVGDACGAASECMCGAACLDDGSGLVCWLICADDSDCQEPETCTATDFGFSVCYADDGE